MQPVGRPAVSEVGRFLRRPRCRRHPAEPPSTAPAARRLHRPGSVRFPIAAAPWCAPRTAARLRYMVALALRPTCRRSRPNKVGSALCYVAWPVAGRPYPPGARVRVALEVPGTARQQGHPAHAPSTSRTCMDWPRRTRSRPTCARKPGRDGPLGPFRPGYLSSSKGRCLGSQLAASTAAVLEASAAVPAACASIKRTTASEKEPPDCRRSGFSLDIPSSITSHPRAAPSRDSKAPWLQSAAAPTSPNRIGPQHLRISQLGPPLAFRPGSRRILWPPRWPRHQVRPVRIGSPAQQPPAAAGPPARARNAQGRL